MNVFRKPWRVIPPSEPSCRHVASIKIKWPALLATLETLRVRLIRGKTLMESEKERKVKGNLSFFVCVCMRLIKTKIL